MKKYFILLLVVLTLGISGIVFGNTRAEGLNKSISVYYEVLDIKYGDTIWDIAKKYKPEDLGIKEYIEIILNFNNLKSDKIVAGESIIIPIYS